MHIHHALFVHRDRHVHGFAVYGERLGKDSLGRRPPAEQGPRHAADGYAGRAYPGPAAQQGRVAA